MKNFFIPRDFPFAEHVLVSPQDVRALIWLAEQSTGDIVELGCNYGNTTRQLAQHFRKRTIHGVDWSDNTRMTHPNLLAERPVEVGINAKHLPNVVLYDIDVQRFEFPETTGFIFIDADHCYDGIKKDSEAALEFARRSGRPLTVAWHDYQTECWPDVTRYLDELTAEGLDLFHIKDTWVVGCFVTHK